MDDESTLYLVRIWRPDGAFRAVVRPVESEISETFNDASELLQFFARAIGGGLGAGLGAGPGAGPGAEPVVERVVEQKRPVEERL